MLEPVGEVVELVRLFRPRRLLLLVQRFNLALAHVRTMVQFPSQ